MDFHGRVESGKHLIARLSSRPSLVGLDDFLFKDGPNAKDVIDICGDSSSGKTLLITQFLAKCLLPKKHQDFEIGGLDSGAILIDTDHHFQIFKLVSLMESFLEKFKTPRASDKKRMNSKAIEDLVKESLNNLIILKCHDSAQMQITFHSLPKILSKNPKVSLILLDSISAYYWQDAMVGGIRKMDMYMKKMVMTLQKCVQEYKVVIAFTRPSYFQSKYKDMRDTIDSPCLYRVLLMKTQDFFSVEVNYDSTRLTKYYTINSNGLSWS